MARKKRPQFAGVIQIDDKLISSEITEELFHCDISACKGACCVEGELGAPLSDEELKILDEIYEQVKPYLKKEGIEAIEEQGTSVLDFTHAYSTPLVHGRECAYTTFDDKGVAMCGIEQAWADGAVSFRKPISCHLYPIRVQEYESFTALNYDRWSICSAACTLGEKKGIPVYEFAKDAIVRAYGESFYETLAAIVKAQEAVD